MSESLKEFFKRGLFSAIFIGVVALLIMYADLCFVKPLIATVCALLAFFSCREYTNLCLAKDLKISKWLLGASAIALALSFYLREEFSFFRSLPFLVFALFAIASFLSSFGKIDGSLARTGALFLGFFYAALPVFLLFDILYLPQSGPLLFIYLLLVTKASDFFAYFGGKLFGKRKLAPGLSPKKTKEGALFGFCASVFVSLFFFFLLGWLWAVFFGILFGILSQIGDLAESLLKRDAGIKDSSAIPGLGGFLDIMDSLVFNTYIFYFFLTR